MLMVSIIKYLIYKLNLENVVEIPRESTGFNSKIYSIDLHVPELFTKENKYIEKTLKN